ncbi:MAG: phage tail assembly protein [Chloroflexi bacterium]|nr:phage tail assembly protein [Chloroflexota bacterium]
MLGAEAKPKTSKGLQTEYEFTLPRGYVDGEGTMHRNGVMRLATAMDEIAPMKDVRVKQNQAYLTVVLLSRVVTKLGTLEDVNTSVVEKLFSADFAYLQDLYRRINESENAMIPAKCPNCNHDFEVELVPSGE